MSILNKFGEQHQIELLEQINSAFQISIEVQQNLHQQQSNNMGLSKNIRDVLQKCDFFCSTEYLRYKKEPQYRTALGGFLSIFLILALLIVFYNKVINTLNKMSITSATSVDVVDDPLAVTISTRGEVRRQFMFGVEIWHHNLNEGVRYFDINFNNMEFAYGDSTNGSVAYPLQPCTLDHWKGYPLILEKFDSLNMNYWLCPPRDIDFVINGKYSSAISRTIQVSVNKCTNNSFSTQPCADSDQLKQFFANFQQKVFFTIYFVNPRINSEQAEFLTYYMEDQNYIIFSQTGGEEAQLMVDDFTIETDDSISPFPLILIDQGSIVQKTAIKNRFEIAPDGTNYCTFFFYKSTNSLQISRSYQKLDQILSYIGGLFGTIALCLFIIRIYNGYSFEIHLGAILYKHDEEKDGFHKYNFWHFIVQGAYNFLKLFGGGGGLERAKGYQRCREELLKQLDILYLLKRVSYLERAIEVMLDDHQLKGIHLLKKPTLAQARRYRKNFKLQQKVVTQSENYQFNRKDSNTTAANANNQPIVKKSTVDNEDIYDFTVQDIGPERQIPSQRQGHAEQSQSSSSDEDDAMSESQNKSITLEQLLRLKNEKEGSSINQRIFNGLSDSIRRSIHLYDEKCRLFLDSQDEGMSGSSTLKIIAFKPKRKCQPTNKSDQFVLAKLLKPVEQNEVQSSQEDHFQYLPNE